MLLELESIATPALWAGFVTFAIGMLVLDLVVFHRQAHETTVREALLWTVVWFCLSLLFNLGVLLCFGWDPARTFLTGYLIEKALSVDNILVFGAVFSSLGVPARLQRRVLIWGIFGALVMRGIFVMAGAALLHQFQWVSYLFGAFLVFTSIKLLRRDTVAASPGSNPIFRLFRRLVPYMEDYRDDRFITVIGNKRYATPLLLVLVAIETNRRGFRPGLRSGYLCRHQRSVHRVHVQHLCHVRIARALLCARRHDRKLPLPEGRLVADAGFRRRQDACG